MHVLKTEIFYFASLNDPAYYNAGVAVANSEVAGMAPNYYIKALDPDFLCFFIKQKTLTICGAMCMPSRVY
jgi:hypothetical protein